MASSPPNPESQPPPRMIPGALARLSEFIALGYLACLKPNQIRVWIVYNKHSDNQTAISRPAMATVAWDALKQKHHENARCARNDLIKLGLLEPVSTGGGFKGDTSEFRVCVPVYVSIRQRDATPRQINGGLTPPVVSPPPVVSAGHPPLNPPPTPRSFGGTPPVKSTGHSPIRLLEELPRVLPEEGALFSNGASNDQKSRKTKPEPSGDHQQLIKYFRQAYLVAIKTEYRFSSRDAAHIKTLLKAFGPVDARGAIDRYLANREDFYERDGHTLGLLISKLNTFNPQLPALPAKGSTNGHPKYRGTPDAKAPEFEVTEVG